MPDPFSDDVSSDMGRLVAEQVPGDNALAMSVGELAFKLKRMVEGEFGHVRLRGEISGWKRVASGHCYMSLKDDQAVIDGVIWKGNASSLAFVPQDGIEVIATGKLTTYPGRSKYQIVIERMELAGAGALMALLEKLKAKLSGEGLFDRDRKQPLPFLPRVIGVVTSGTGAVIRDILHRLEDRCPTHVIVWPVKVQGEGSAAEIAAAVRGFDAIAPGGPVPRPDLVIVARGGGSVEDLWSFNEEVVVRAVAGCTIPIISAVGHETDTTLCDFAADLRAPTPTAAAEIAVPVLADLRLTIDSHRNRTERCARRYVERGRERLDALSRLLPKRDQLLGPQRQRADDVGQRLDRGLERRLTLARGSLDRSGAALRPATLERKLESARARLDATWRRLPKRDQLLGPQRQRADDVGQRLDRGLERRLTLARGSLDRSGAALRPATLERKLESARAGLDATWRLVQSLNPDAILDRGYARVTARPGGETLASAGAARGAGTLTLHFRDGMVDARTDGAGDLERSPAKPHETARPKPAPSAAPRQPSLF